MGVTFGTMFGTALGADFGTVFGVVLGTVFGAFCGASTFFMILRESTFSPVFRSRARSFFLAASTPTRLYRSSSFRFTSTPRSSSTCRFVEPVARISFSMLAATRRSSLGVSPRQQQYSGTSSYSTRVE